MVATGNEEAHIYTVGDKKAREKEIRKRFKVISEKVQKMFPNLSNPMLSEDPKMNDLKFLIEKELRT
jgi:hypothetical protein